MEPTHESDVQPSSENVSLPSASWLTSRKRQIIVAAVVAVVALGIIRYVGSDADVSSNASSTATTPVSEDEFNAKVDEAVAKINEKRYDDAIKLLSDAAKMKPDRAIIYYNIGVAHQFSNRLKEAEAAYSKSLSINNTDPNAYYNRGLARRDQGNLEGAAEDLKVAGALAPKWSGAKYNLAEVLKSLGQEEEAAKALERAKQIDAETGK